MGMISEFKAFAMKGNVVDMAIGVIIGGAFGAIVGSLVTDVMLPVVGLVTGGVSFSEQAIELKAAVKDASGAVTSPAVLLAYGKLIDAIIKFLIVAFCLFTVVKAMNAAKREEALVAKALGGKQKEAAPPPPPPAPPRQEVLLEEIRDLLKKRSG
jgi:large conductance mechanosensitive channel